MSISVIPPHHVTEDNGTAHSSIPSISSLLRALLNSAEKIMALRPPRIGKFTATDWPDVGCAVLLLKPARDVKWTFVFHRHSH